MELAGRCEGKHSAGAVESCLLPQRGLKGHVLSTPEASSLPTRGIFPPPFPHGHPLRRMLESWGARQKQVCWMGRRGGL